MTRAISRPITRAITRRTFLAAPAALTAAALRATAGAPAADDPPPSVANPTWADLYYPPLDYRYFRAASPPITAASPPAIKARWIADAAFLAYGCHRQLDPTAPRVRYSDREMHEQCARGGFAFDPIGDWSEGARGTQGFFATARAGDWAILSFRGTEADDPKDQAYDALILEVPAEPIDARNILFDNRRAGVHKGFRDALNEVWPDVESKIAAFRASHPQAELVLTGHSLGGAIATVTASRLPPAHNTSLYTFGCPMVGNAVFNSVVRENVEDRWFRYVDGNDLVTHLPGIFPYKHDKDSLRAIGLNKLREVLEEALEGRWHAQNLSTHPPPATADHAPSRYLYYIWK